MISARRYGNGLHPCQAFFLRALLHQRFLALFLWHTFLVINVKVFVAVYVRLLLPPYLALLLSLTLCKSFRPGPFSTHRNDGYFFFRFFFLLMLAGSIICKTTNSLAHRTGHMADRAIVEIPPVPLAHFPNVSIHLSLQYNYLMQFDYLPKSDLETGALRTEDQLKEAIRSLQVRDTFPPSGCSRAMTSHPIPLIYYAQFHN